MASQKPTDEQVPQPQRKSRVKDADAYSVMDFSDIAEEMKKAPPGTKWTYTSPTAEEIWEVMQEEGLPMTSALQAALNKQRPGKCSSRPVDDPHVRQQIAAITAKAVKAGVYSFDEATVLMIESLGRELALKVSPVWESMWQKLHEMDSGGNVQPAGKVADVLDSIVDGGEEEVLPEVPRIEVHTRMDRRAPEAEEDRSAVELPRAAPNRLVLDPDDSTWLGIPARVHTGAIENVRSRIPRFKRQPFSLDGGGYNPYRDAIIRLPSEDGEIEKPVPVGIVSKSYALLQHTQVLDLALNAFKGVGIPADKLRAELTITTHGERMMLCLRLPRDRNFEAPDNQPIALQLVCINSVEGSTRFSAHLGWLRLVCANGMVVGATAEDVRQFHNASLSVKNLGLVLEEGMKAAELDKQRYREWARAQVSRDSLAAWADGPVRKLWGVKAATRAFHIALGGADVRLGQPFEKALPSERVVRVLGPVPGAIFPAEDVFAASQVLSWLASQRRDLSERVEWMKQIPGLMDELIVCN